MNQNAALKGIKFGSMIPFENGTAFPGPSQVTG
jgi:hypothetical protein